MVFGFGFLELFGLDQAAGGQQAFEFLEVRPGRGSFMRSLWMTRLSSCSRRHRDGPAIRPSRRTRTPRAIRVGGKGNCSSPIHSLRNTEEVYTRTSKQGQRDFLGLEYASHKLGSLPDGYTTSCQHGKQTGLHSHLVPGPPISLKVAQARPAQGSPDAQGKILRTAKGLRPSTPCIRGVSRRGETRYSRLQSESPESDPPRLGRGFLDHL